VEIALLSAAVWLGVCPSDGAEEAKGNPAMSEFDLRYLFLIPLTLAEAFLLWALWQLQKRNSQGKKASKTSSLQRGEHGSEALSKAI